MTYSDAIEYLYSQVPMFQNLGAGAYKPGLDTTLALSELFDNPHQKLKAIHIGGTNGKGSTTHTVAAILQSAGMKVGLYTSPHLTDFRERIRVNGAKISQTAVVEFLDKYLASEIVKLHPTFFELTTIMAFDYFIKENVDIAVIEVGLGGRLDSTNIITPLVSVITNISKDHTAQLGSTLEAIAAEKAGIIKENIPAVIGLAQTGVRQVFEQRALQVNTNIVFAQDFKQYSYTSHSSKGIEYFDTPYGNILGELSGDCQLENTNTILTLLSQLPFEIPSVAVQNGFSKVSELTGLQGRWMHIPGDRTTIVDTGHNIGGWEYLGPRLKQIASECPLSMVLGFVSDKDINAIMATMPTNAKYYFVTPSVTRGRDADSTTEIAKGFGLNGISAGAVIEGYNRAIKESAPNATIFVGGSTFVVADLLSAINAQQ